MSGMVLAVFGYLARVVMVAAAVFSAIYIVRDIAEISRRYRRDAVDDGDR